MASVLEKYPANWEGLVAQMIEATQEAIADASLHKTSHILTQGMQEATGAAGFRYIFLLEDDWEPGANTSVYIVLDTDDTKRTIAGTVFSKLNTRITLVTETPLPDTALEGVTMFESTLWLLERLRDAWLRLQEQGETLAQMGAKTVGLLPGSEARRERQAHITTFRPDADQARAIEIGMASERLLLIGPPGTGKTSTESALTLEYLLAGETVLLIAHNNVALDTAMKRLKQHCEQSGNAAFLKEHLIVCLGISKDPRDEAYYDMALQGIVDRHLGKRAQERDKLQREQSNLEEERACHARDLALKKEQWVQQRDVLQAHLTMAQREHEHLEIRERQRLTTIAKRLTTISDERRTTQEQMETAEQTAEISATALPTKIAIREECEQRLQLQMRELSSFHARSSVGRLLNRLSGVTKQSLMMEVEQCQMDLATAKDVVTAFEQRQHATHIHVFQLKRQLLMLNNEARQLLKEQQQVTDDAKRVQMLATSIDQDEYTLQARDAEIATKEETFIRIQRRCNRIQTRLDEIEEEQHLLRSRVLAHAKIIGTIRTDITTNPFLRDRLFDAVTIDEASMASLAYVLMAAAHATKHVTLFGDPTQLTPIVQLHDKRKAPLAAYWLGTDLFSHLRVALEDADAERNQVVLLSQQSQMLPEIAAPYSQFIYGGHLKNRLDPHHVPLQLDPYPEWPLLLVDTSDVDRGKNNEEVKECRTKQTPRSTSKYNLYHVRCIVQLVHLLLPQFPDRGEPLIGVITPYEAQKSKLRQILQANGLLHLVQVGTIHSFPYIKYPCIIFDTTEGPELPIGQFTSNTWGRHGVPHDATRLISVAHSRAHDKLIYIANVDYINQKDLPEEKRYRQKHLLTHFVNYTSQQGSIASKLLFGLALREVTSSRKPSRTGTN